jgi:phage terminase large subunit-like protein
MPRDFFATYLRHTKGDFAGKPFELLDWQDLLFFRPVWGWLRLDGTRRFRDAYVQVAKKNGKSAIASGTGLLLATGDGEMGAEVYAAAGDEKQARIVFDEAANMAKGSPEYLEDAGVEVLTSSIVQPGTRSFFKVLTAKAGTKHGFNVHGIIFDELHVQKSRTLYETLARGVSARRQPLIVKVTTAGDDRESIGYELYEKSCKVRDGTLPEEDTTHLPVIFEAKPDDDWTAEATWYKANPSLGITKSIDYMAQCVRDALNQPRTRNDFLRLDLNVWTESRAVWITPEAWAACGETPMPENLRDLLWCGGLDLSSTRDLTCFAAVFKIPDEDDAAALPVEIDARDETTGEIVRRNYNVNFRIAIVPTFFIPAGTMRDRIKRDRVPYDVWKRGGWLRETSGDMIDQNEVARVVQEELRRRWPRLAEIGFDRWSALPIVGGLREEGAPMVEVGQGFGSLSAPCKLFEAMVHARRVIHDRNPVMNWCVTNCEVETSPSGDVKPRKPDGVSQGTRRIDGVSATVTALARLMVARDQTTVYKTRGIVHL